MFRSNSIVEYIEHYSEYKEALLLLRELALATGFEETVKWGAPAYTLNGKNVLGLAAFKSYVGIWFHNGVYLKDESGVLMNAQEGVTKAMRQWRFSSVDEIDIDLVKQYMEEAKANQAAGKEFKFKKEKPKVHSVLLETALDENAGLKKAYAALTPGKQREFAAYIQEAKQEKTRESRLQKCLPMILNGVGLNDKYR